MLRSRKTKSLTQRFPHTYIYNLNRELDLMPDGTIPIYMRRAKGMATRKLSPPNIYRHTAKTNGRGGVLKKTVTSLRVYIAILIIQSELRVDDKPRGIERIRVHRIYVYIYIYNLRVYYIYFKARER